MAEKLNKAVVLYMPPQVLNPGESPTGASCGKCMMGLKEVSACTIVYIDGTSRTNVDLERGVCGLYVGGGPVSVNDHKIMPTVPRSVAGYIESPGVPTHCGNCEYWQGSGESRVGACRKVEGIINFWACCNAWEQEKLN